MLLASFGSIMMNILYIIIAIFVLLTMVLIHELGHYVAGRVLGFKITEFSIGFGKVLWQKTNKRGEKISLRLFPLGGFCAFYGENDGDEESEKTLNDDTKDDNIIDIKPETDTKNDVNKDTKNNVNEDNNVEDNQTNNQLKESIDNGKFNSQKPWKRIIVFLAGVTFNFLSAFIFSIIFLSVGAYDGYAFSPANNNVVQLYSVKSNEVVGRLQQNTTVYAINGIEINYARTDVFSKLVKEGDTSIVLTIDLNGTKQDVKILKNFKDDKGNDIYGVNYATIRIDYNFGDVMRDFIPFTFNISVLILQAFWSILTGAVALKQLGGPISTITQMTVVASYGIANFLYLLPLLAANLAIFNLLPIPGLDGAHVVFTSIEWIRGKPIKREVENAIHGWGIICLFAFVIIIDIVHLIAA